MNVWTKEREGEREKERKNFNHVFVTLFFRLLMMSVCLQYSFSLFLPFCVSDDVSDLKQEIEKESKRGERKRENEK